MNLITHIFSTDNNVTNVQNVDFSSILGQQAMCLSNLVIPKLKLMAWNQAEVGSFA